MASYYVSSTGSDSVSLTITPEPGYPYYRVFVRLASQSAATHDQFYYITSTQTVTVSGLASNTAYVVNVGYSATPDSASGQTWLGASNVQTQGGATPPTPPPTPPAPTASASFVSAGTDNAIFLVNGDANYPHIRIFVYKDGVNEQDLWLYLTATHYVMVSNLSPGATYNIGIYCYQTQQDQNPTALFSGYVTTAEPPEPTAQAEIQSVTQTGFTVRIYPDSNYPVYRVFVYESDGVTPVASPYATVTGSYGDVAITGLSPAKTYIVSVYSYLSTSDQNPERFFYDTVTTNSPPAPHGLYIDTGSEWVKVTAYLDNGSAWLQVTPTLDNGAAWE